MTKIEWAQFGLLTARARAKRIWQIVAIVAIVCLIAAAVAAGWLFSNRHIQLERHAGTISKIQQEHNRLTDQLQAQNNLLTSKIKSLEASAQ